MEAAADSAPEPPERFDVRFALASAAGMLAVCALLWLAGWWLRGWPSAWPRFQDDAFYYLVIARNAAAGHGFTMDQLSRTNGFQPLWQWMLVAVAWLCGGGTGLFLAAAQALSVLLFCAAVGVSCGLARPRLGTEATLVVPLLLLLPRFLNVALSGMESSLAILIECLVLLEATRSHVLSRAEPRIRDARTGVLLGLLMLARLDTVFVLVSFAAAIALRGLVRGQGPFLRSLGQVVAKGLAVFWPTLLLVVPYLLWNALSFGSVVPISGVLKTGFPVASWSPQHVPIEFLGLLVLGVAGVSATWWIGRDFHEWVRTLAVICVGLALHALYTVVYMRWAIFAWHFATFLPAGALGAALLARAFSPHIPVAALRTLLCLLLGFQIVAQSLSMSRLSRTFTRASREAGVWVSRELPPDAILGMKDSGVFSYFAQRRVVNLDGVANSFEYEQALCSGELERYLRERGVRYIAQHSVPPRVRIGAYDRYTQTYPCRLPGGRDGQLALRRDLEVFRGTPYANDAGRLDQLFIWELPAPP